MGTPQTITSDEDSVLEITLGAVDDDDADISFSIAAEPSHGFALLSGNTITYQPIDNFNGAEEILFAANDGFEISAAVAISITVAPVNDRPTANDITTSTFISTSIDVQISASDADGDDLSYSIIGAPQHGTITGDGPQYSYTPNPGYVGVDSFVGEISDGQLSTEITAHIEVVVPPLFAQPVRVDVGQGFKTVVLADLNEDGILDIVSSNSVNGGVVSFAGQGDGSFGVRSAVFTASAGQSSLVIGRFDADVHLDVATTGSSTQVSVLLGNGDGAFASETTTQGGPSGFANLSLSAGDINLDGKVDLGVANFGGSDTNGVISLLSNQGGAAFQRRSADFAEQRGDSPMGVTFGDYDGDGDIDIAATNSDTPNLSILANNGLGGFTLATVIPIGDFFRSRVVSADFDEDGDLDLAITRNQVRSILNTTDVLILQNVGNLEFVSLPNAGECPGLPSLVEAGDIDGDGLIDLAVGTTRAGGGFVTILHGAGDGFFEVHADSSVGGSAITAIALGDVDQDGDVDVVTANSTGISLLLQN